MAYEGVPFVRLQFCTEPLGPEIPLHKIREAYPDMWDDANRAVDLYFTALRKDRKEISYNAGGGWTLTVTLPYKDTPTFPVDYA